MLSQVSDVITGFWCYHRFLILSQVSDVITGFWCYHRNLVFLSQANLLLSQESGVIITGF